MSASSDRSPSHNLPTITTPSPPGPSYTKYHMPAAPRMRVVELQQYPSKRASQRFGAPAPPATGIGALDLVFPAVGWVLTRMFRRAVDGGST
ncbi:hypothetical protein BKA62DRAFT_771977 [Auriculariales sp. MPI-PUGE-AT-0066]|nr:hypothetical protein BKA62DRAFT_771977 [Auriculariales sp. MPI-PUGE-AT-0066]